MRNPLSIRITDALREKLDDAYKESGRSLTQEVTRRLNDSFAIKVEPDPFLRAITYLIGQATLFIGKEWKTNPWMFQAFREVVSLLLERVAPPGELTPPETAKQIGAKMGVPPDRLASMTPEGYGFAISGYDLDSADDDARTANGNELSFRFLGVCHAAGSQSPWRPIRRT